MDLVPNRAAHRSKISMHKNVPVHWREMTPKWPEAISAHSLTLISEAHLPLNTTFQPSLAVLVGPEPKGQSKFVLYMNNHVSTASRSLGFPERSGYKRYKTT
uniref:Uncharacterized protein n=1 Tax=Eutreptiella gymnastica TaxID=73025 RepID=A0A7S1NSW9_9EUGL